MARLRLLAVLAVSFWFIGCSLDASITDLDGKLENDFERSTISVNNPGIADGSSFLTVILRLVNSNGTVVEGFRPEYKVTSGSAGLIHSGCTKSDSVGVSVCIFRSSKAGWKKIKTTNLASFVLKADLEFVAASTKQQYLGMSSSAQPKAQGGSGYKISSGTGTVKNIYYQSPSGYKAFLSVQGQLGSVE